MSQVTTVNPATEQPLQEYGRLTDADVDRALQRSTEAFESHRQRSFAERGDRLFKLADRIEADVDTHAEMITREMGKPIAQARAEVSKCAWVCRYYAEEGERMLADEPRDGSKPDGGGAAKAYVTREPLGPVLAIMPWNFPYWQVFRFAVPTLMAGGTGLLKHADNTMGSAALIESLFAEAGFVDSAFQSLNIDHDQTAKVIGDPRVRAVTLTGSERAGRAVAKAAGEALKPTVLELGGSDAFVVLADADLDAAVEIGVKARTQNTGQSCIAAKRFILEKPIAEAFTQTFVDRMHSLSFGDPFDASHDLGPLARGDLRDTLHQQVTKAIEQGATLRCGGNVPDQTGYFYPATVLTDVGADSVAFKEELFGPVASITIADDPDHAIELANATRFGLGGSIFSADTDRAQQLARRMHTGGVFINQMTQSHPNLPFGGIGDSGYGRELAEQGIRAFVNEKTLWVQ